jgi:hypothetical protein
MYNTVGYLGHIKLLNIFSYMRTLFSEKYFALDNCDLANNKNSTVIKLETCTENVLFKS